MGRPLKIAKGQVVTITAMNGTTEVVTTNANFTNLGIIAGMPFTVTTSSGNLVAGTTYWILKVINSGNNSTFTVSATQPSANVNNTPFNVSTVGPVTVLMTVGYAIDTGFSNPNGSNTATNSTSYGAVGGNTALYGKQALVSVAIGVAGTGTISASTSSTTVTGTDTLFTTELSGGECITDANGNLIGFVDTITDDTELELLANSAEDYDGSFVFALSEAGYIVRQKGKTKYLVQGATSGLVGACYTANVANSALTPNTMNIISTNAASGTNYISSLNDYQSEVFPTQIASGSLVAGTLYTIYKTGTTNWTSVGSASNMTGVTFKATGTAVGTGTAVLANVVPDVIATFGTAYAANTYPGTNPITGQTSAVSGQPNPIVTINNA